MEGKALYRSPRIHIWVGLGTYYTIFNAEVVAISIVRAKEILKQNLRVRRVVIYSDSQAAIKAINACLPSQHLRCVESLAEEGGSNKLLFILGARSCIKTTDKADEIDEITGHGAKTLLLCPKGCDEISTHSLGGHAIIRGIADSEDTGACCMR